VGLAACHDARIRWRQRMRDRGIPWRARFAAALIDASPNWPASAATRIMGAAARVRLPRPISQAAIGAYVRYFDVELGDVDPVAHAQGYPTFDAFFTRQLREGVRPVDHSRETVISPADGTLRELLPLARDAEIVAKDHAYTLSALLADEALAETFAGGWLASVYLHPRDYHRVHCPCDALGRVVTVVPGRLLPVTQAALTRNPRLFSINERMIHLLDTMFGTMAVVMVAAFGVANMSCSYRNLEPHPSNIVIESCDPPVRLRKGDELGVFHLGSTVLVLAGSAVVPAPGLETGPVRIGQTLFVPKERA